MSIAGVRAVAYKPRDSWWTVFLVDPYASRLVRWVAGHRWVTPNRLTLLGTALGVGSAACFALADRWWLLAGAALFHLSFVVDCMDGKLARLQGSGSVFGGWLDFILDQFRVVACGVALMGGQYLATDRPVYLALAFGVVVLDLFHYLDLLQISKVKDEMRRGLEAVQEAQTTQTPQAGQAAPADGQSVMYELSPEFDSRFRRYARIREFLLRYRIRPKLISGIEFQMAVFIVAPLTGPAALIPVTLVAGGLLMAVELAVIYKLWLAASAFGRQIAELEAPTTRAPEPATTAPDPVTAG
jgi:phosphatidylglycerophosphate synthase